MEASKAKKPGKIEGKGGKRISKGQTNRKVMEDQQALGRVSCKDWGEKNHSIKCRGEPSSAVKDKGPEAGDGIPLQSNGGIILGGISITNLAIQNCKRTLKGRISSSPTGKVSSVERIWKIGSQLGVSFGGIKDSIIRKIRDLEDRDQQGVSDFGE